MTQEFQDNMTIYKLFQKFFQFYNYELYSSLLFRITIFIKLYRVLKNIGDIHAL